MRRSAILAILVISLLFVGCVKQEPQKTTPTPSALPTTTIEIQSGDPCEKLESAMRDKCFLDSATKAKNSDYCAKIQDAKVKADCVTLIAKGAKIYDICDKIEFDSAKYECYLEVAIAKSDASICYKIPDEAVKNQCLAEFANPSEEAVKCTAIPITAKRNDCLRELAFRTNQTFVCTDLLGSTERDACRLALALRMDYLSICDEMESKDRTSNCYAKLAIVRRDISICGKIIEPPEGNSQCLIGMANAANNSVICGQIPLEYHRNFCYELFVSKNVERVCIYSNNDFNPNSECKKIAQAKYSDKCSYGVGVQENVQGGYCWNCTIRCS